MKLTTRCGSTAVEGLNNALLAKAAQARVLRCARVRVDTTVVPLQRRLSDRFGVARQGSPPDRGHRPADPGRLVATVRTKLQDESRAAGRRAHDLNAKLRTRSAEADEAEVAVVRVAGCRTRRAG